MNNMVEFSTRLKQAREKAGLTQAQLAQAVKVSTQSISAYEKVGVKGKTPSLDTAAAIARELGVSLDYLSGLSDSAKPQVEFRDLSDVVAYLKVLTNYFECTIDSKELPLPEELWEFIDYGDGTSEIFKTESVACMTIHSSGLAYFFDKRNKLFRLVQEGTIPVDMYQTWLTAEIEHLKQGIPLKLVTDKGDFE